MANEEHVALLKQGVEVWNRWRQEHPEVHPDLSRAYLSGADLREADLRKADLRSANLHFAHLSNANLHHANLHWADLHWADLRSADLSGADLRDANLRHANLCGANLNRAVLNDANLGQAILDDAKLRDVGLEATNLSDVRLKGADLNNAVLRYTTLAASDLSQVLGLETVTHRGPSYISIDTIYKSRGQIPEVFLRGAGVPENFIEYMRSLTGKAFEYYSCFLSYSSKDQAFAERLYADLQAKGVRCWFAPEDLKIGDKFWDRIDESIRLHDKLLVILSEHSVESDWVEDEVTRALDKERQHPERTVLFPIRLDEAVMTARHAWASSIRLKRHIGDFSHWKDHDDYQKVFARLLRDLQAEGHAAGE